MQALMPEIDTANEKTFTELYMQINPCPFLSTCIYNVFTMLFKSS